MNTTWIVIATVHDNDSGMLASDRPCVD